MAFPHVGAKGLQEKDKGGTSAFTFLNGHDIITVMHISLAGTSHTVSVEPHGSLQIERNTGMFDKHSVSATMAILPDECVSVLSFMCITMCFYNGLQIIILVTRILSLQSIRHL